MNSLEKPLSQWTRFLARLLGASLPCEKEQSKVKRVFLMTVFCPFLTTLVVLIGVIAASISLGEMPSVAPSLMFVVIFSDATIFAVSNIIVFEDDPLPVNSWGAVLMSFGALGGFYFTEADNLYHNTYSKLFNKNFKKYPFKEMLKNKEGLLRRQNALHISNKTVVVELYCCVKHCNAETMEDVVKWCNASSEHLQYRHLEELRGRVLENFKNYRDYTAECSNSARILHNKTRKEIHDEIDGLLAVYALRNQLEAASQTTYVSHSAKKPRRI